MKARFRLAAATAVLALVLAAAAGCATRGARTANSGVPAPVADAEWHSLVKSGRAAYLRNDFKAALPLFASAANRSRALDDPNRLAVALLDQARCLEELRTADTLALLERRARKARGLAVPPDADGPYAVWWTFDAGLETALADARLPQSRRDELAVAWIVQHSYVPCVGPDRGGEAIEALGERWKALPASVRARYLFARTERALPSVPAAGPSDDGSPAAFLLQCPPPGELPSALRARGERLWAEIPAATASERLDHLEAAASLYREASRPDGVACSLAAARMPLPDGTAEDRARAAGMLLRAASACDALGCPALAQELCAEAGKATDDPAVRKRAADLGMALAGPLETVSTPASAEPKGDSKP